MWTVVLIPLAIPLAIIGVIMAVASRFIKTENAACPACGESFRVEPRVRAAKCPHCETAIRRYDGDWVRV